MMKILLPTLMLIPTTWLSNFSWLWTSTLSYSFLIAALSLTWLKNMSETGWTMLGINMATDTLSTPLLILTCWLLPLMIMASQNHLKTEPQTRQRLYITLLTTLQFFLILAFSSTELIMFYVMFEATLIPTLIIITRWGNQMERLNAGTYLLFYTLISSLPLLIALLMIQSKAGSLSLTTAQFYMSMIPQHNFLWLACFLGFLVKMPLYGVHLWLPKAHVEAPIAGSMILAAVLLKLGGYGMMRISALVEPVNKVLIYPFMALALWGIVMTGLICLQQMDLKSLIAYSSVGHMGLVVGAILTQTPEGYSGAVTLMIAHGLTSSALFCLANSNYERTHSRVMLLARGLQMIFPLMTAWWLAFTLANLALPPLPNLMGELTIIISMFDWSWWTFILTGAGTLITAAYSLYMFITTQRGNFTTHIMSLSPTYIKEHLLMLLHLMPLLLLIMKPEIISY
uniref:NADH-ubiquinone oxidoreductase chain 4 n=1 Tax=Cynoglossus nanhaiensis TaxID=2213132 RepID=A0A7M4C8X7_9PLEU|nr:NADH dehydrogenase subunit 4 [Cynoglossus nanhaiensis]AWQ65116.1 NADH dehydrogenase subunit 4 [Cynoglossus nanhaiensis]QNV46922.1 NADH dehydrogenase subunit 4 [Cynoglossus nanhaiensis]